MSLLLLSLIACGKDTGDSAPVGADATYHADVRPVLEEHCTRCHYDGGLGVGDFNDLDHVNAFSDRILARALDGTMPPAVSDPECHDFIASDQMTLNDDELAMIQGWVDGGLPEGDAVDYVQPALVETELEGADLELLMTEGYTPTYSDERNPGNEYRCFVLDPELEEDIYVTAMHPIIDQLPIAHHVVLFTASRSDLSVTEMGPQGFDCIDGGAGGDEIVGAWAPGMVPVEFPEGHGLKITDNQVFVVQMHYFSSGEDTDGLTDRSGYALRTATEVDKEILLAPLGIYNFSIPAGDNNYSDGSTFENDYFDLEVHGVFPHMHRLGKSYSMSIREADGDEQCVVRGDYDFDNQLFYMFDEPIDFDRGAAAEFECTWDNSEDNPDRVTDVPVNTGYGERTDEEMCFFFTFVSVK